MTVKRIVSFLPSATELLYEFGMQDKLYGVTHECNYPKDATLKPIVIDSVINSDELSSKEIDARICQLLKLMVCQRTMFKGLFLIKKYDN